MQQRRSKALGIIVAMLAVLTVACDGQAPGGAADKSVTAEPVADRKARPELPSAVAGVHYQPSRVVDFYETPVYDDMSLRDLWHSRTFPIDGVGTCQKCHAGREPRSYCLFGMRKFVRCVHDAKLQVLHPNCRYIDHPKGGELVPALVDWYATDPACRFMDGLMPASSRAQIPPR